MLRDWIERLRWLSAGLLLCMATIAIAANGSAPVASQPTIYTLLTGPFGGLLAVMFGTGAIAGYGFHARTLHRLATARIAELREEHRLDIEKIEQREDDARAAHAAVIDKLEREVEYWRQENKRMRDDIRDMALGRRPFGDFREVYRTSEPVPADMIETLDRIDRADSSKSKDRDDDG